MMSCFTSLRRRRRGANAFVRHLYDAFRFPKLPRENVAFGVSKTVANRLLTSHFIRIEKNTRKEIDLHFEVNLIRLMYHKQCKQLNKNKMIV